MQSCCCNLFCVAYCLDIIFQGILFFFSLILKKVFLIIFCKRKEIERKKECPIFTTSLFFQIFYLSLFLQRCLVIDLKYFYNISSVARCEESLLTKWWESFWPAFCLRLSNEEGANAQSAGQVFLMNSKVFVVILHSYMICI